MSAETIVRLLGTMPPVKWDEWVGDRTAPELSELVKDLDELMEGIARFRGYVDAREKSQDHDHAVRASNTLATRVRKALGFAYPRQDIHF